MSIGVDSSQVDELFRTTAGSQFCATLNAPIDVCVDCQRDVDCVTLGFPARSACLPIGGDYSREDACEGGMACLPPRGYVPPEP
jgi:hypothetical protein